MNGMNIENIKTKLSSKNLMELKQKRVHKNYQR